MRIAVSPHPRSEEGFLNTGQKFWMNFFKEVSYIVSTRDLNSGPQALEFTHLV